MNSDGEPDGETASRWAWSPASAPSRPSSGSSRKVRGGSSVLIEDRARAAQRLEGEGTRGRHPGNHGSRGGTPSRAPRTRRRVSRSFDEEDLVVGPRTG